ncbi:PilN domain-containing protein [Aestuariibacter halophilus]|uniref:PilN domain-containing protein n=1 Tax=Fluctibacter halophilus TaxID=226011 RepID=A0ABS8GA35_9ALTE|nr:PilN domain-containing protein [Aestuariibacter halophilus]MCC2617378.1 PilN domain-containing protein [Aestuariibacter halophilus]
MAHINLMPWRESLRQKQKQQYLTILVGIALVVFALVYFIGSVVDNLIGNQNLRNQYMEQQIALLDNQIAQIRDIKDSKQAIEQRMALIEQLQTSRNVAPIILDELANIVPPGISFRSMSRSGNSLLIMGVSESNNRLSDFMRNVENSDVFINGELSSIVADTSASNAVSEFKLTFSISPQVAPDFSTAEKDTKK